ncbi:MAG: hypothetical protein KBG15_23310, partial [Kofleriaceae bacterium]|nr:hypothetical protein [Kofleriaceae bacterium]
MSNEAAPSPTPSPMSAGTSVPADFGLPGLGLSMQLAGGIFSVLIGAMLIPMMMTPGGSGEVLWFFILASAAVGRSLYHAAAGRHLLYNERPLSKIPTYFAIAAVQTLVTVFVLVSKLRLPQSIGLGIAVGLMLWPTVL